MTLFLRPPGVWLCAHSCTVQFKTNSPFSRYVCLAYPPRALPTVIYGLCQDQRGPRNKGFLKHIGSKPECVWSIRTSPLCFRNEDSGTECWVGRIHQNAASRLTKPLMAATANVLLVLVMLVGTITLRRWFFKINVQINIYVIRNDDSSNIALKSNDPTYPFVCITVGL